MCGRRHGAPGRCTRARLLGHAALLPARLALGLEGATTPWYAPNMRLFRQQKGESWNDVVRTVAQVLAKTDPTQY